MWILLTKTSTIYKSAHSFVNTPQARFSPLASCLIFFDTTSFGIYFKVKLYSLVRVNPTNFGIMISQVFILTSKYYITFNHSYYSYFNPSAIYQFFYHFLLSFPSRSFCTIFHTGYLASLPGNLINTQTRKNLTFFVLIRQRYLRQEPHDLQTTYTQGSTKR